VELHLVLQSDVASDVGFKFLDDLLVNSWRIAGLGLVFVLFVGIFRFIIFNHMNESVFHALLD
jgi:hypothetical protein